MSHASEMVNSATNSLSDIIGSEQALMLAMMEMVLQGVSTRKVTQITEELCGTSFSKSTVSVLCQGLDEAVQDFRNRPLQRHYPFVLVDAMYIKVREGGRVRSKAFLIAIGVNEEGYREVIGFDLWDTETELGWKYFFERLIERGLRQVQYVISDSHKGLVNALTSGVCRGHVAAMPSTLYAKHHGSLSVET